MPGRAGCSPHHHRSATQRCFDDVADRLVLESSEVVVANASMRFRLIGSMLATAAAVTFPVRIQITFGGAPQRKAYRRKSESSETMMYQRCPAKSRTSLSVEVSRPHSTTCVLSGTSAFSVPTRRRDGFWSRSSFRWRSQADARAGRRTRAQRGRDRPSVQGSQRRFRRRSCPRRYMSTS